VGWRDHQQGVAVRFRLCHRFGADNATGARPIFDDERLLERLAQPLCERAGDQIGGPPTPNGTIMRTVLEGYSCAESSDHGKTNATTSKASEVARNMECS
jgi:hypothetical protein